MVLGKNQSGKWLFSHPERTGFKFVLFVLLETGVCVMETELPEAVY